MSQTALRRAPARPDGDPAQPVHKRAIDTGLEVCEDVVYVYVYVHVAVLLVAAALVALAEAALTLFRLPGAEGAQVTVLEVLDLFLLAASAWLLRRREREPSDGANSAHGEDDESRHTPNDEPVARPA